MINTNLLLHLAKDAHLLPFLCYKDIVLSITDGSILSEPSETKEGPYNGN